MLFCRVQVVGQGTQSAAAAKTVSRLTPLPDLGNSSAIGMRESSFGIDPC